MQEDRHRKSSRNNVVRRTQTKENVPPNIFRLIKVRKKIRLIFEGQRNESKVDVTVSTVTDKEKRLAWSVHSVNCNKLAIVDEKTYIDTSNQQLK